MNLELQLEMCLNETYSRVRVGKDMCDMFHIGNGLKQGDARVKREKTNKMQ